MTDQISTIKQNIASLQEKIAELDGSRLEHNVVLDALAKLDPKRKCFRMVGSVLVERSVEEVQPAVKQNKDTLDVAMSKMSEELKSLYTQLQELQAKSQPQK
ncbi:hypothetical protein RCL1_005601 [Eukaryota sp. TZLM3-RCL]